MLDEQKRIAYFRWTAAIASIAGVALVIATWGSRCAPPQSGIDMVRCGHPLSNWLYDFQSLITGVLAVVAAVITVRTMNKNTRDVVYSDWKTLVFNIDFHAKMLGGCIQTIRTNVLNAPPTGLDRNEWNRFFYGALISLKKLHDILIGAQQQGFTSYSLGSVADEIEKIVACRQAIQSLCDREKHNPWPLTAEERAEIDLHVAAVHRVLIMVEQGTQLAFEVFVDRSKINNPMKFQF